MNVYAKPPLQGKFAFRQGLIYGVGLGVIGIINTLIARAVPAISFVSWIIDIVVFIVVGMLSAQKTGRVATGTIAGLWTGLIGGIISFIWSVLSNFVFFPTDFQASLQRAAEQAHVAESTVAAAAVFGVIIVAIFGFGASLGIGAGFGAIGGAIGKNRAKTPPPAEYQEAPYPGMAAPYAGAPQQSGAPVDNPYQDAGNVYSTPPSEPTVQASPSPQEPTVQASHPSQEATTSIGEEPTVLRSQPPQEYVHPESTPEREPDDPQ